ncbi:MAG: ATP-binding cassette domain-containing protein [Myxococcota bacterium]
MIEVEGLTKHYGDRVAVRDATFRVDPGEIVGFLGPNGAGKTTTLRMLTGYLRPTSGKIRIGEVDALEDPIGARRLIGYMSEGVPLYFEMRIAEYLLYRAKLKGVSKSTRAEAVERSLAQAELVDVRERIIGQLSKGYRQRIGLADALLSDPPLLILDEPSSGLDPNQIRHVRSLIQGFAGQKTILLSTHILPEVEAVCERVIIIHKGQVVGEGKPNTLRTSKGSLNVVAVGRSDAGRLRDVIASVDGVQSVSEESESTDAPADRDGATVRLEILAEGDATLTERVFSAVADAGLTLRELRRESTSLEEVFRSLTTEDSAKRHSPRSEAAAQARLDDSEVEARSEELDR